MPWVWPPHKKKEKKGRLNQYYSAGRGNTGGNKDRL